MTRIEALAYWHGVAGKTKPDSVAWSNAVRSIMVLSRMTEAEYAEEQRIQDEMHARERRAKIMRSLGRDRHVW